VKKKKREGRTKVGYPPKAKEKSKESRKGKLDLEKLLYLGGNGGRQGGRVSADKPSTGNKKAKWGCGRQTNGGGVRN